MTDLVVSGSDGNIPSQLKDSLSPHLGSPAPFLLGLVIKTCSLQDLFHATIILLFGSCHNEHVICDYVDSQNVTKALMILLLEYFTSQPNTKGKAIEVELPPWGVKEYLPDRLSRIASSKLPK
ncbi:hypothetical protein Y1Q_0003206 [Alligator mississippiensis]|uniref:Uncharacterized protein n=1 Tax=Alligator mississippiensis TaxID=8496 RepID=A0A151MDW0_ALLMI|nr:hypothetical protein Y1Q_0003206 [Alligator mississippiensis]